MTKTYPEDALKCALVDEVLEGVEEANALVSPSLHEKDSEKKVYSFLDFFLNRAGGDAEGPGREPAPVVV